MEGPARCQEKGLLVNARSPVPGDPSLFYYAGSPEFVGCNRLRCTACGADVRQQAGLIVDEAGSDPAALYAAEDWSAWPKLRAERISRLYACRCGSWSQTSNAASLDDDEPLYPMPPWACAGHPPISLPYGLDGVSIEPGADMAGLVRAVLIEGRPAPDAIPREQSIPRAWLAKLYQLLAPSAAELAERLSRAMSSAFSAAREPKLRNEVVGFFRLLPGAPGAEALVERFLTHPADFVGVELRGVPSMLEETFAWLVESRVRHLQAKAVELDPSTVDAIVRGLVGAERRARAGDEVAAGTVKYWLKTFEAAVNASDAPFAARAEEVVGEAPSLAVPLLEALQGARSVRLLDVAGRVAAAQGTDREALRALGERAGGQLKAALRGGAEA